LPPPPPQPPVARGSPPWASPRTASWAAEDTLAGQLERYNQFLMPTPAQWEQKRWVAETLTPLLKRHTGGELQNFGSCENGFWSNGSDVDSCLVLRRCSQKAAWITKLRLVQCLVERDRLGKVQLVTGARVPIAKVMHAEGAELCDVSINNVAALENSRFVATFAHLDARVPPLGRFIKHWASQRRINTRVEGTLSTYTLMLQLFYFLQIREVPVLPRLMDLLVGEAAEAYQAQVANGGGIVPAATYCSAGALEGTSRCANALVSAPEMDVATGQLRPLPFVTEAAAVRAPSRFPALGRNSECTGMLLHEFFQLWGHPEFSGVDGRGRTVYVYDGTREENELGVLVMRCPLTGKNVNPFATSVWALIHSEFSRAASMLRHGRTLDDICEPATGSPTACLGRAMV